MVATLAALLVPGAAEADGGTAQVASSRVGGYTVTIFTGPSLPELDATANAPPPTTNATTPATPAVVRSLRSMMSSPTS